jgi:hypothetical protein
MWCLEVIKHMNKKKPQEEKESKEEPKSETPSK